MKRTRKLFSDINKNAKPVAKRDKIIIDEQDISAIVTRRILAETEFFDNGNLISLSESTNLDSDDITHFTNITNLYDVVKIIRRLFKLPKGTNEWDEDNIQNFKNNVEDFLNDAFTNKEEYKSFFIDKTISLNELRNNNSYLLFRPVGFLLFAKLYVEFKKCNKLDYFISNINKICFQLPESPFNKVLWNKGKMETKGVNQTLAFELCLYLLNSFPVNKEQELLTKYRNIIKNDDENLPLKVV